MDSISSAMTAPWSPSPVMTRVKRETCSSLAMWLLRKVLEVDFHRHVLLYPALPDLEAWVPETDSCTWEPRRVLERGVGLLPRLLIPAPVLYILAVGVRAARMPGGGRRLLAQLHPELFPRALQTWLLIWCQAEQPLKFSTPGPTQTLVGEVSFISQMVTLVANTMQLRYSLDEEHKTAYEHAITNSEEAAVIGYRRIAIISLARSMEFLQHASGGQIFLVSLEGLPAGWALCRAASGWQPLEQLLEQGHSGI
jgi:hypothetical protein